MWYSGVPSATIMQHEAPVAMFSTSSFDSLENRVTALYARHHTLVSRLTAIQTSTTALVQFMQSVAPLLKEQLLKKLSLQNMIIVTTAMSAAASTSGGRHHASFAENTVDVANQRSQVLANVTIRRRILECCMISTGTTTTPSSAPPQLHINAHAAVANIHAGLTASSFDALVGLLHAMVTPLSVHNVPSSSSSSLLSSSGMSSPLASPLDERLQEFVASICYLSEGVMRFPDVFMRQENPPQASSRLEALAAACEGGASVLATHVACWEATVCPACLKPSSPPRKKSRQDSTSQSSSANVSPSSPHNDVPQHQHTAAGMSTPEGIGEKLSNGSCHNMSPIAAACNCIVAPATLHQLRQVVQAAVDFASRIRSLQQL